MRRSDGMKPLGNRIPVLRWYEGFKKVVFFPNIGTSVSLRNRCKVGKSVFADVHVLDLIHEGLIDVLFGSFLLFSASVSPIQTE
jgi:hypothetical protein